MGVCTCMQRECPRKLTVVLTCGDWSRKEYYVHCYQTVLIIQHKYDTGDKTDSHPVPHNYYYDAKEGKKGNNYSIKLSLSALFTLMTL